MQVTANQERWLTTIVNSVVVGFFVSVALNLLSFGFTTEFLTHWPKIFAVSSLVSVPLSKFVAPHVAKVVGDLTGRPVTRPTTQATEGNLAPDGTGIGVQAAPAASTNSPATAATASQ